MRRLPAEMDAMTLPEFLALWGAHRERVEFEGALAGVKLTGLTKN